MPIIKPTKTKLNLASGSRYRPDYFNIDNLDQYPYVVPDLTSDVKTLEFEKNSLDEISSRQFIQYLNKEELEECLKNWFSWLKPGGILHIEVANLEYICRSIVDTIKNQNIDAYYGPHSYGQLYGIGQSSGHKSSHCPFSLSLLVYKAGFEKVRIQDGSLEKIRDFQLFAIKP